MKALFYIILGIILGIITINLATSTFNAIMSLKLIKTLVGCLFTYGAGFLTVKCFKKAHE